MLLFTYLRLCHCFHVLLGLNEYFVASETMYLLWEMGKGRCVVFFFLIVNINAREVLLCNLRTSVSL